MIKKTVAACVLVFFLVACGDEKTIDSVTYTTYGLFNEGSSRNPDIRYRLIVGNLVWSIIGIETVLLPIYFIGFSLFEPISKKSKSCPVGVVGC